MVYTCIYNRKLFGYKKKNEILPFSTLWMDLEGIMLSKIVKQRNINAIWYCLHVIPIRTKEINTTKKKNT